MKTAYYLRYRYNGYPVKLSNKTTEIGPIKARFSDLFKRPNLVYCAICKETESETGTTTIEIIDRWTARK